MVRKGSINLEVTYTAKPFFVESIDNIWVNILQGSTSGIKGINILNFSSFKILCIQTQ